MGTVDAVVVQRLLESDQEDPVLVLLRGKPVAIAAGEQDTDEYRGALFLTSRRTLVEQAGRQGDSLPDRERLAAALSEMADLLGA
jgi:hypothetical protein